MNPDAINQARAQGPRPDAKGEATSALPYDPAALICSDDPSPVHDCWNTIGVEGNGTCRELQRFIHCRNCPVYSTAGLQLLNQPLTLEYRREQTGHYAATKTRNRPAKTSVVIFRLGPEWLALPTAAFQEVAQRRGVHSLPHRRRSIALGLVNIRGELLICASLARFLGLELETQPDKTRGAFERLLVVNWDTGAGAARTRLAFPVDEVHGIQRIHTEDIKDPPATLSKSALTYTNGVFAWRERTVGCLEAESLFNALNRSLT
jgi:chemotaxis-related protein WspD